MPPPKDASALSALSRAELQALARREGIRANQKSTIIIDLLVAKFAGDSSNPTATIPVVAKTKAKAKPKKGRAKKKATSVEVKQELYDSGEMLDSVAPIERKPNRKRGPPTKEEDLEDQLTGSLATSQADSDARRVSKRRKVAQAPPQTQDQSAPRAEGRVLRQRKGAQSDQTQSKGSNAMEANRSEGDGAPTTGQPGQEQNAEDVMERPSREIAVPEFRTIVPQVEMWRRMLPNQEVESAPQAAPGPHRTPVFTRPPPVFTKPPPKAEDAQRPQASSSSQRVPEPEPEPESESERSSSPYVYRRPLVFPLSFEESISIANRARADTPSSPMLPTSGQTSAARAFREEQRQYLEAHPSMILSDDNFTSPLPQKPSASFVAEPQPLDLDRAQSPTGFAIFEDDDTPVEKPGPHECGTGPKAIRYVMRQLVPIMNEQVQMQADLDLMKEQIEKAEEDVREAAKDMHEIVLIRMHAEDLVRRMKVDRTLFDGTAQSQRREEWREFLSKNTIP